MEPEIKRMRQIHGVYKEALALPVQARAVFVAGHRERDPELADAVQELLASAEQVEHNSREVLGTPRAGSQVGCYRLLEQLGQGGVGLVYLAERVDETPMRVAVKLLKRGMDSDHVLKRFFKERQILAALNHPHIAQLFDAGAGEDGLPYFVMEYVDGLPITQYCEERSLDLSARLNLFLRVCEAVRFAHQNLVIHRDLKPANILVTEDGQPKMLDFGISGLLDPHTGAPTTATVLNERMLTVEYASPEQLRGEPLGTTSDIYSLGVILYQLITGERPYRFHGRDPFFAARRICATPPETPSMRIRNRQERRDTVAPTKAYRAVSLPFSRDIDNIALKALAADPGTRYRSVDQLMHDIHRYFKGLPVVARPAGLSYVVGKYLRRNRWTIALTSLFFALIGAVAAYTNHQQQLTQQESETAAKVLNFLSAVFEVNDPNRSQGDTITAKDLLDQRTRQIDADTSSAPEVRARLMLSLGRAYSGLGLFEDAVRHFEKALTEARYSHGENSLVVADYLLELARNKHWRAPPTAVKSLLLEALDVRRRHYNDDEAAVRDLTFHLAQNDMLCSDYPSARRWFSASLSKEDGGPTATATLETMYARAALAEMDGRGRSAEQGWLTTVSTPTQNPFHPLKLLSHHHLAEYYRIHGLLAQSQEQVDQARVLVSNQFSPHHPIQGETLWQQAALARVHGDVRTTQRLLQQIDNLWQRSLPADHFLFIQRYQLEGDLALDQGWWQAAEAAYRKALNGSLKNFGPNHIATGQAQAGLAEVYFFTGRRTEAAAAANAAYTTLQQNKGEGRLPTLAAAHLRACILLLQTPGDAARQEELTATVATLRQNHAGDYWLTATTRREAHLRAQTNQP